MSPKHPPSLLTLSRLRERGTQSRFASFPLIASVLAGIGASLCCVGPLVLLGLGVSGAWIANLTALESFRPIFLGLALVLLVFAWRKLYRAPACAPGQACAVNGAATRQKAVFWVIAPALLALLAFPWYAPIFY